MVSLYIYVVGGRLLYDSLRTNLPLPSRQTVLNFLYGSNRFREGVFTFQDFAEEIKSDGGVPYVWVCEDDTKIVSALRYNVHEDTVVGFVLPTNSATGTPLIDFFKFTSIEDIKKRIEDTSFSSYAKLVSVRSLIPDSRPFILVIYGTTGGDKTENTVKRWDYIVEELEKLGIKVLGISSDGAPSFLRTMQINAGLPSESVECPELFSGFFFAKWSTKTPCYINDPTHLLVKLHCRLMKRTLMMGEQLAGRGVLLELLRKHGKEACGITDSHLTESKDAMNFDIAEKCCSERITNLLTEPYQQATKVYLRLNSFIKSAYINRDTDPETRIYKAFYVALFSRMWRAQVLHNKHTTLKKDFLSANSYVCIELNAHSLLLFLIKCREMEMPQLFLPYLASSQDCESFFRLFRALGTTFNTVINFNILELLHKARRVMAITHLEQHIDPEFFKFAKRAKAPPLIPNGLPTDARLFGLIDAAYQQARQDADTLGITYQDETPKLALASAVKLAKEKRVAFAYVETDNEVEDFPEIDSLTQQEIRDIIFNPELCTNKPEDAQQAPNAPKGFLNIEWANGYKMIRKSTLLWSVTKPKKHLCQDRLQRFIEPTTNKAKRLEQAEIELGTFVKLRVKENVIIAQVVGFSDLTTKNELPFTSCPIKAPKGSSKRGIGLLVNSFTIDRERKLVFGSSHNEPINIKHYISHLEPSEFNNN